MKKNRKLGGNKIQDSGSKIEPRQLESIPLPGNIQNEDSTENIAAEPQAPYSKNTVRTFSSLEEMNEEDAREMAGISAIEHLRNATMRTQKIFAEELKKEMSKTIKFR